MDFATLIELDTQLLSIFNGSNSLFFDGLMVTLTSGLTWIPLYLSLLYLVIKNNETTAQIMLVIGICILCLMLSAGVSELVVKPLVGRLRPCNNPWISQTIQVVNQMRSRDFSFFSSHASNTFAIALFFSLLVRSKALTISLILWSLLNCYTRLYLGLHYPSDIFVGLIWGATVGTTVYFIYKKIGKHLSINQNYASPQSTITGYTQPSIYVVITVLTLTLCYSVIRAVVS